MAEGLEKASRAWVGDSSWRAQGGVRTQDARMRGVGTTGTIVTTKDEDVYSTCDMLLRVDVAALETQRKTLDMA